MKYNHFLPTILFMPKSIVTELIEGLLCAIYCILELYKQCGIDLPHEHKNMGRGFALLSVHGKKLKAITVARDMLEPVP